MILQGDNRETLKTLTDNSIDAIVTDPPYGIDFLGKAWDANTGALETYQECLRVLKPGGYILAFSAARTYHHLAVTLEQAGFEIRDQIMWLYSSGFPKAQDIGKAIEKRGGKRTTLPSENSSKIVGMGTRCPECNKLENGSNQHKCTSTTCPLREVLRPADNEWAGWKTALKPAHEPICLARKPFKGSTIDNVLEHGVGALNIDESRVEWDEKAQTNIEKQNALGGHTIGGGIDKYATVGEDAVEKHDTKKVLFNETGRFPSNVIGEVEDYQKFFYCPKVSRKERHQGVDNNHPTVKPVELMKYLIKLVTPENSVVLDPFCGSGSTGMAAVELGHEFIGCELDPAYVEIAEARIAAWNTDGTTKKEFFK